MRRNVLKMLFMSMREMNLKVMKGIYERNEFKMNNDTYKRKEFKATFMFMRETF